MSSFFQAQSSYQRLDLQVSKVFFCFDFKAQYLWKESHNLSKMDEFIFKGEETIAKQKIYLLEVYLFSLNVSFDLNFVPIFIFCLFMKMIFPH